jgi:hypothetical protein
MNDVRTCECNWSVYQTCDKCNPDELATLRAALEEAKRDIDAYRGALGYSVPGDHTGRLSTGFVPVNGIAQALQQLLSEAEAAIQSAEAKVDSVLRVCEWSSGVEIDGTCCPLCGAWATPVHKRKHRPGCELAALLLPRPDAEGET